MKDPHWAITLKNHTPCHEHLFPEINSTPSGMAKKSMLQTPLENTMTPLKRDFDPFTLLESFNLCHNPTGKMNPIGNKGHQLKGCGYQM